MISKEDLELVKRHEKDVAEAAAAAAAIKAFHDARELERRQHEAELRKLSERIGHADARVQESGRARNRVWGEVPREIRDAASAAGIELRQLEHERNVHFGNELQTKQFVDRVAKSDPLQPQVLAQAKARHKRDVDALAAHDKKIAAAKAKVEKAKKAESLAFEDARKAAAVRLAQEEKAKLEGAKGAR